MLRLTVAALAIAAVLVGTPSEATPAACASDCTVQANTNTGYVPPVIEIVNGADVRWLPSNTSHPTAESFGSGNPCFLVAVGANVTPEPVVFNASGDGVTATVGTETKPCTSAVPVGESAWAVTYTCKLHAWMNGSVVVDR